MAENDFVFAVARIRVHELSLLTAPFLQQLIASADEKACLDLLAEKGWETSGGDMKAMFAAERKKTWDLVGELSGGDLEKFSALRLENDYHNLKAAIKDRCSEQHVEGIYVEEGVVPLKDLIRAAESNSFQGLPRRLSKAGAEAMETLLKTGDGQLCDCILDRAALEDIRDAGRESGEAILEEYGESFCRAGDVKIAVRSARTGKPLNFLESALAPCSTISTAQLAQAAMGGVEQICNYLKQTGWTGAADALQKSPSSFEKWCDNSVIRSIRPELYESSGAGPIAAYVLARTTEMKSVRIILSGKKNGIPEETIRERVRDTYV